MVGSDDTTREGQQFHIGHVSRAWGGWVYVRGKRRPRGEKKGKGIDGWAATHSFAFDRFVSSKLAAASDRGPVAAATPRPRLHWSMSGVPMSSRTTAE